MATGKAHKFNVLKYKILYGLFMARACRRTLSAKELAEFIDVDVNSVRATMCNWRKKGITYARRISTKHEYRYQITKSGIKAYIEYRHRLKHGFSLNRLRRYPKKVDAYMSVSSYGRAAGMTIQDIDYSLKEFEERLDNIQFIRQFFHPEI